MVQEFGVSLGAKLVGIYMIQIYVLKEVIKYSHKNGDRNCIEKKNTAALIKTLYQI